MSEPLINLVVVCWPLAISNRHHQLQYHYHQKGKENIRTKWKWKWQTVPTWWYHKSVRSSEMRSGLASGFQTRWRFTEALPPMEKKTQWVGICRTKSRMDYFHCWVWIRNVSRCLQTPSSLKYSSLSYKRVHCWPDRSFSTSHCLWSLKRLIQRILRKHYERTGLIFTKFKN